MTRWIDEWGPERMTGLGGLLYAVQKWQENHSDHQTRHMTPADWEEIHGYRREFDAAVPASAGPGDVKAGE